MKLSQLHRRVIDDFSQTNFAENLASPELAEGKCIVAAERFAKFCKKRGVRADVLHLSGGESLTYKPEFVCERLRWVFDKDIPPMARIPLEHAVVRLDGSCFVDWTARQFDSRAAVPLISKTLPAWRKQREWPLSKGNLFAALDDVAIAVYRADEEHFEGGCGDIAVVMEKVLALHNIPCKKRAGLWGREHTHVWLEVDGTFYDPIARTYANLFGNSLGKLTPAVSQEKENAIIALHTDDDDFGYSDDLVAAGLKGRNGVVLADAAKVLLAAQSGAAIEPLMSRAPVQKKTLESNHRKCILP